eukprot:2211695-Prymnesium_polylepis.1
MEKRRRRSQRARQPGHRTLAWRGSTARGASRGEASEHKHSARSSQHLEVSLQSPSRARHHSQAC